MKDALKDILVIELGTYVTAPLAGMMLADLGARVIKVEHPTTGDPLRHSGGHFYSPPFAAYNWNKESIQLDLQSEADRASLARLLARADVLISNFRPGVLKRMGLGKEAAAPLIFRYGTEEQRRRFLPRIVRGEIFFCVGLSEPDTGSDLASVRTRATRTDKGWVLRGRKIWTTNAHRSHYICTLARTSGQPEDRHKGLSQFLVDLSLPGVEVRPIRDITGDAHFCEVLFEDVELPADALIGEEGSGWEQVMSELAFERSGPERLYSSIVLVEAWLAELRRLQRENDRFQPDDTTLATLGRLASRTSVLRAMSLSIAARLNRGEQPVHEASMLKALGAEFEQSIPDLVGKVLERSDPGQVPPALMQTLAYLTQICPAFSLRGGTRQILRGIVACNLNLS